ncbi:serine/threonine-protein kinase [Dactylosporangium matsuzakiense]|uniref:serine/threonine-protein kinase n=1 Tax=Dactylosporangium matsuzakiense TaxID=53360 RepID=UPI0021C38FB0|nr:serine/threonine-protein kinase [Dactylosporangium matsuzakiense]
MLGPGDVLGDRYRLEEFVASGGMGQVFRATDKTLGRTVAVKVLLPGHMSNTEFGRRFRSEARIMASLGHPGVVGVYDYGETPEGTLFLVMAFVDGRPLGELINEHGTLPVGQTLDIVAQAADALHAAHERGIIHRDVKPGNLLVTESGAVTLVDFGVARSSDVTSVTKVNAVIGTALYMSPEQASGRPISPAADIYALGVVAYHCVTGAPPFNGNSPLEIALKHLQDEPPPLPETVPVATRALIERAMAKNPEDRYPTAAAMASAARAAGHGTIEDPVATPVRAAAPTVVVSPPAPDGADDGRPGRPAWVLIVATLAGIALITGVVLAIVALTREVFDPKIPDARPPSSAAVTPSATNKAPANPGPSHNQSQNTSAAPASPTTAAPPSSPAPGSQPPASPTPDKAPTTTAAPPPTTGPATPPPASVEATIVVGGNGG